MRKNKIDNEFIEKERKKHLGIFKKQKDSKNNFIDFTINKIKEIYNKDNNITLKELFNIFNNEKLLNYKGLYWNYQELLYFIRKNQDKINIKFKKNKIDKKILIRIKELKNQEKTNKQIAEILNIEDIFRTRDWNTDLVRNYYNQNVDKKDRKNKIKELELRIEKLEKIIYAKE
jgi:hypothetical protein